MLDYLVTIEIKSIIIWKTSINFSNDYDRQRKRPFKMLIYPVYIYIV